MTTIAWDGRYLAADGQCTNGATILSTTDDKIVMVGDRVVASCGCTNDIKKAIDMMISGEKSDKQLDVSGLYILKGKCFSFGCDEEGFVWSCSSDHNNAKGSGADHALTAMDCGKDAREAINLSAMRDIYTGGHITYYDINCPEGGVQKV
jgi:ATP-dependent protease HslVU (ClpYQ) peptidase subunit